MKFDIYLMFFLTFATGDKRKMTIELWRKGLYDEFLWSGVCCELGATKSPVPGKCRCNNGLLFRKHDEYACYYGNELLPGPLASYFPVDSKINYLSAIGSAIGTILPTYEQARVRNVWMEDFKNGWQMISNNSIPFKLTDQFGDYYYVVMKEDIDTFPYQGKFFYAQIIKGTGKTYYLTLKVVGHIPEYEITTSTEVCRKLGTYSTVTTKSESTATPTTKMHTGAQRTCENDSEHSSHYVIYGLIAVVTLLLAALIVLIIAYLRLRKKHRQVIAKTNPSAPISRGEIVFNNPTVLSHPQSKDPLPPTPNVEYEIPDQPYSYVGRLPPN